MRQPVECHAAQARVADQAHRMPAAAEQAHVDFGQAERCLSEAIRMSADAAIAEARAPARRR